MTLCGAVVCGYCA